MRPISQPQSLQFSAEHTFTPYSYSKQMEFKSPTIQTNFTTIPTQYSKKTQDFIKGDKIQINNQSNEIKKMNSKNNHMKTEFVPYEFQPIRRQESQPNLRTTCPNVLLKFDANSIKTQSSTLRNTTHNMSKLNAVITQVRKNQQQEQRNMKKNGVAIQSFTPTKVQSPLVSMSDSKKPLEKSNYKSLNQMWTNKVSSAQKPKCNIIHGFEISKQLGKGKFGEVYLGRHVQTGFIVALKKIIKAKVIQYKMLQQFKREIRLHSSLDHPNIVKFYGFFEDGQNIYLILEYISGGTLFDYLAEKDILPVKQAAEYLKDTIQALSYMHDRSIAHRDIKPENIVLTAEKVAKLCDFGWSALVQSSRTTYCGTFDYAPPEILQRKNYDTAVDIWCMGVLTFELLTGKVPFEGGQRKQIMDKILSVDKTKINYPLDLPEQAKNFIELLVQKDPTLRPKCKQLLKHPFIANNAKNNQNYKERKI